MTPCPPAPAHTSTCPRCSRTGPGPPSCPVCFSLRRPCSPSCPRAPSTRPSAAPKAANSLVFCARPRPGNSDPDPHSGPGLQLPFPVKSGPPPSASMPQPLSLSPSSVPTPGHPPPPRSLLAQFNHMHTCAQHTPQIACHTYLCAFQNALRRGGISGSFSSSEFWNRGTGSTPRGVSPRPARILGLASNLGVSEVIAERRPRSACWEGRAAGRSAALGPGVGAWPQPQAAPGRNWPALCLGNDSLGSVSPRGVGNSLERSHSGLRKPQGRGGMFVRQVHLSPFFSPNLRDQNPVFVKYSQGPQRCVCAPPRQFPESWTVPGAESFAE